MVEIIETLLAEKGQRYEEDGQAIASHGKSIVFLPKGVQPDQKVRVKLLEIKEDSRGRMMYRAVPAPVEFTEKWKDNGDGTASKIKITTDWLLQESQAGVIDTRKLEIQEDSPRTRTDDKVVWGSSLVDSYIEETKVMVTPIESEVVKNGALEWEKNTEREDDKKTLKHPLKEIDIPGVGPKWPWLNLDYSSNKVQGNVRAEQASTYLDAVWTEMPDWWRQEVEARFPVCSCGERRYNAQNADSYAKCEACRKHEHCEYCGKELKITIVNNQMICDSCKASQEQEQLIAKHFTDAHLKMIMNEAKKLLDGQALEPELALAVLKTGLEHIPSDLTQSRMLDQWREYQWYYFTDEGVFGTKFEPAALQVLQYLSQAVGNSLVEFIAWIAGGAKPSSLDFYLQTQIEGQEADPKLTKDLLEQVVVDLEAGKPVLADRLRGSEADRTKALAGYNKLVEKLGSDSSQVEAVERILQSREQDYSSALKEIREAEDIVSAIDRGEVLTNWEGHFRVMGDNNQSDLWVIDSNGEEVEPTEIDFRKRYTSEGDKRWEIVDSDQLAIRWNRWQASRKFFESWEVAKLPVQGVTDAQITTARAIEPHERFEGTGTGFDLTQVSSVIVCVSRERYEIPLRKLQAGGKTESKQIRCEVFGWDPEVLELPKSEVENEWTSEEDLGDAIAEFNKTYS